MHDCLILGGGPAGLAAALYASRYGLDACLLDELYLGGQIVNAAEVENYPGYADPVSGGDLADYMEKQTRLHTSQIFFDAAKGVDLLSAVKTVKTSSKVYEAKTVIIAMGQNPRSLGVEREKEFMSRGVSYCATCDGNFFKGKDVAVAGGGNTALSEAAFLARICKSVSVIHRRNEFRAAKAEVEKARKLPNVKFILESQVTALLGKDYLEGIEISGPESFTLPVEALFIAVGAIPKTELFKGLLNLDPQGFIITDENMETGIPGVYAAGDIRKKSLRQVVTAVADGAIAAHSAMEYCTGLA
ncbi:MAG: FAD-dependent oxidoreductase [Clostridiales bacterium]|jgi:thioredoxin reductase (NADPH)|nr:FAD-dependent oxidoreductase [Clostridiales bacterium]MDR2750095.1 FAD-dependent oxidoreductase [Clostridiales bacterium]